MDLSTLSGSEGFLTGGALGFLFGAMLVFGIIISIAFYVYFALAWQTIARKLKYDKPWLAWIPFANISMVLQLGGFHWALIFLILIPIVGWIAIAVLIIIANWRVFEKRNYPGWLALTPIAGIIPFIGWLSGIATPIILGFVAWKDQSKAKK